MDRCRQMEAKDVDVVAGSPLSDISCHAAVAAMSSAERSLYLDWAEVLTADLPPNRHILLSPNAEDSFYSIVHRGRKDQAYTSLCSLQTLCDRYTEVFSKDLVTSLPHCAVDNAFILSKARRELTDAVLQGLV